MNKGMPGALALLIVVSALAIVPAPTAATQIVGDLNVSSTVVYRNTSFIAAGNINVLAGGDLTFDNTSVLMRMTVDEGIEIRVAPGGTLRIVNGSTFSSTFQSVAYALRYHVFAAPGSRFVLQNSSIDYPYWIGVGDQNAVIEDSVISHAMFGVYGYNLTVSRMTFIANNIGLWVSGHSLVHDSTFDASDVYGGILDGTSVIENSTFRGSITADLALLDNATARDNVHSNSGRGVIALDNATIQRETLRAMSIAGVQLGDADFRYGCGVFITETRSDWLNLHQFTFYHRTNNSVTLEDLTVEGSPLGIAFGREVWRRSNDTDPLTGLPAIDPCDADPPPDCLCAPLWNHIDWTITRPTVIDGLGGHFNGSIRILAGGSLTLRGGLWRLESAGTNHQISVDGGALIVEGVDLRTGLIDYAADTVRVNGSLAPDFDIIVNAGTVSIRDSIITDLGTNVDPGYFAGLGAAQWSGPILIERTHIFDSKRGVSMTSDVQVTVDSSNFEATLAPTGPALVMSGGSASVINSTLSASGYPPVYARSGTSSVAFFGSDAQIGGAGTVDIVRYGYVRARVLWEDLRPIGFVDIVIKDFATGLEWGRLTSGADGWAPALFIPYRNTTWAGFAEQGGAVRLYEFAASLGGASASTLPMDISAGALATLVLPDDGPPTIALNLPREYYSNLSGGIITGWAQDNETGVSVVELSLDGGPYFNITTPSAPQLGVVNFSTTITGLAEGIHVVAVRAWDSVGNTAETYSYFVYDARVPSVLFNFQSPLTTNHRDVVISGRLTEYGSITIKGNTTNASSYDLSFALVMHLDSSSEIVEVVVRDLAGNTIGYPIVVRLDEEPPVLQITNPVNGSWVTTPRVTISGRIDPDTQLFLNGVPLSVSGVNNFTILAALSEGENVLTLRAVDLAGNQNEVALTLFLDSVFPTLDIVGPDNLRPFSTADLNLTLRTEPGTILTVGNDSLVANASIVVVPVHFPEGRTVLAIEAHDLAGNSVRKSFAVTIDTKAPTLSFVGGSQLTTANATLRVVGLTEPNAFVDIGEYSLQADASGSFAITLRLHPGENRVAVAARDAAGNRLGSTLVIAVAEPRLASPPGLAAPDTAPAALLVVGIAAMALAPFVARWVARRRA